MKAHVLTAAMPLTVEAVNRSPLSLCPPVVPEALCRLQQRPTRRLQGLPARVRPHRSQDSLRPVQVAGLHAVRRRPERLQRVQGPKVAAV